MLYLSPFAIVHIHGHSILTPPKLTYHLFLKTDTWKTIRHPVEMVPFLEDMLSFCWEYIEFMISLNMKGFNGNLVDLKKST